MDLRDSESDERLHDALRAWLEDAVRGAGVVAANVAKPSANGAG